MSNTVVIIPSRLKAKRLPNKPLKLINKKEMPKIIEEYSIFEKIKRSKQLLPVIFLISAVIGSIYTGIATATEAASLGVVGALILSYFQNYLQDKFLHHLMKWRQLQSRVPLNLYYLE